MRVVCGPRLPLVPLLRAYTRAGIPSADELGRLPVLGPRCRSVLAARVEFLNESFLDSAGENDFRIAVGRFYRDCVQPPLHAETLMQRCGLVRHALSHLLR